MTSRVGSQGCSDYPTAFAACLFDLDGVLTKTAAVHAEAWKEMFDAYLKARAEKAGEEFVPFDPRVDYDRYVDGKPRYDGVRSFLASRGIELPEGDPSDPPGDDTVCGLGNRKNELVLALIEKNGVEAYEGSVRYVEAARDAGLRRAVVSSSANCEDVLKAAGIDRPLRGAHRRRRRRPREASRGSRRPTPTSRAAGARGRARRMPPCSRTPSPASRRGAPGNFGCVVGVDRVGQAEALRERGADIVVQDLEELLG